MPHVKPQDSVHVRTHANTITYLHAQNEPTENRDVTRRTGNMLGTTGQQDTTSDTPDKGGQTASAAVVFVSRWLQVQLTQLRKKDIVSILTGQPSWFNALHKQWLLHKKHRAPPPAHESQPVTSCCRTLTQRCPASVLLQQQAG